MSVVGVLRSVPLRWRLTLAFVLTTAVVLTGLGWFLHVQMRSKLDATIQQGLRQRAGDFAALTRARSGELGRGPLTDRGDDLAQVLDASNHVVDGAPGFQRRSLLLAREARRAARHTVWVPHRALPGEEGEGVALLAAPAGRRIVVVGATLDDRNEALRQLTNLLLLGIPAALLLAGLGGYLVAGRGLRPIERMRSRADAIHAGRLSERLPVPPAHDEVGRLAATLNAMLARLEDGFRRERTFVADAGHELRTPLARLSAELELAQRPGRSPAELRDAVASAADDTQRLRRLSEDLLLVAGAEQGRLPVRPELVPVSDLVTLAHRQAAGAERPLEASGDEVEIRADRLRLEQAVVNLVDNALRHGSGTIELDVLRDNGAVEIHVRDRGPGFAPGFEVAAFDRFRRGDDAREGEGSGLGLAIVSAIAHAHGGEAGAGSRPGGGADVWIRLPVA